MVRATYRRAIEWVAANDDNEWLHTADGCSVTAALVADLYGKTDLQVRRDLISQLRLIYPRTWDRPLPWEA